jgi:hypothetical protein
MNSLYFDYGFINMTYIYIYFNNTSTKPHLLIQECDNNLSIIRLYAISLSII